MSDISPLYLQPTYFIDCDNPLVRHFAEANSDISANAQTKAIQLYYAVRDKIQYDPFDLRPEPGTLRASAVAQKGSGYCVAKAVLLAAVARQQKIPARLGFADVTNHLSTAKLRRLMESDVFVYHGYTELYLQGKWVKATPAFNISLCTRFNVRPLDFDGINDSLFHEFDTRGQKHMEYMTDHGHFPDLPFDRIFSAYEKQYPGMFERFSKLKETDFQAEAEEENQVLDRS
jgi:transglutaminase-like putative cysteine protease